MSGRAFDLGDVLSVTTGRLVSTRHIDGVYEILGFMTGEQLMTHQLPRACDQCRPHLLAQHPDLAEAKVPDGLDSEEKVLTWLDGARREFGETRFVAAVPTENPPDPLEEACDLVGAEKVWVFPEAQA